MIWQTERAASTVVTKRSEEGTRPSLFGLGLRAQNGADGLVKDVLESLLGEGRTFQVLYGANLLGHCQALWVGNGGQLPLSELLHSFLVLAQIELGADQDDGCLRTVMAHFSVFLFLSLSIFFKVAYNS